MLLSNYSGSSSITFENIPSIHGRASELVEMNTTLLENIGNYTLALARCEHQCIVENASEVILEGAITDFFGRIIDWLVAFWKKLVDWVSKKWDAVKKWFSTDYKKWYDDNKTYINKEYTGEETFSPSCKWYTGKAIVTLGTDADNILKDLDTAAKETDADKIETKMEELVSVQEKKLDDMTDEFVSSLESEIDFDLSGAKAAQTYMLDSNRQLEKALAKAKTAASKIISEAKKQTTASSKENGGAGQFKVYGHAGKKAPVGKDQTDGDESHKKASEAENDGRDGESYRQIGKEKDTKETGAARRKAALACYTKGSQLLSKVFSASSDELTKGRADSFKYLKQYVSLSRAEYSKGREDRKNESSYSLDAFL